LEPCARGDLLNDTLVAAAIGLVSAPFFGLLETKSAGLVVFHDVRYSVAGLGYRLASVIAGDRHR
jgi:hypothetical protein